MATGSVPDTCFVSEIADVATLAAVIEESAILAIASVPLEMLLAFSAVIAAPLPASDTAVKRPEEVSEAMFVNPAVALPKSHRWVEEVVLPLTGTSVCRSESVESAAVDVVFHT